MAKRSASPLGLSEGRIRGPGGRRDPQGRGDGRKEGLRRCGKAGSKAGSRREEKAGLGVGRPNVQMLETDVFCSVLPRSVVICCDYALKHQVVAEFISSN